MSLQTALHVSYGVLWVLVLLQTVVLITVVRHLGGRGLYASLRDPSREAQLRTGTPAPAFELPTIGAAQPVLRSDDLAGSPVLLCFVSPDYGRSTTLPSATRRAAESAGARLVLVCLGPPAKCAAVASSLPPDQADPSDPIVLCDEFATLANEFRIKAMPRAVLIDATWRVLAYGVPAAGGRKWSFSGEGVAPAADPAPAR